MTATNTTSFDLSLAEIIEEAFERAGGESRSGYDVRTARRSLNLLMLDWANRGVNMWTIEQDTITLVPGTATYDIPADTVDIVEQVIRTNSGSPVNQSDLTIQRIPLGTYSSIPNKLGTGRPIQFYFDRQTGTDYAGGTTRNQTITVWPVPNNTTTYTFVYWRLRRMKDAGNGVNTFDIPFRFLPCLVAGLAFYLAEKLPEGQPRLQMLKMKYEEAWDLAQSADRDRSTIRVVPRIARVV